MRALNFQKEQFEQQEKENRLDSQRTRITIPGTTTTAARSGSGDGGGREEAAEEAAEEEGYGYSGGGKSVVRYLVQIEQIGIDGQVRYAWMIKRRYNEFWELQKGLKESVRETKALSLPGKMGLSGLASGWIDGRRLALEKYMQVSWLIFRSLQMYRDGLNINI